MRDGSGGNVSWWDEVCHPQSAVRNRNDQEFLKVEGPDNGPKVQEEPRGIPRGEWAAATKSRVGSSCGRRG